MYSLPNLVYSSTCLWNMCMYKRKLSNFVWCLLRIILWCKIAWLQLGFQKVAVKVIQDLTSSLPRALYHGKTSGNLFKLSFPCVIFFVPSGSGPHCTCNMHLCEKHPNFWVYYTFLKTIHIVWDCMILIRNSIWSLASLYRSLYTQLHIS